MNDQASDEALVRQVIRQFDEALARRDLKSVLALCTSDVVFIGSGDGEQAVGHDAIVAMATGLAAHAADVAFDVEVSLVDVNIFGDVAVLTSFGTASLRSPRGERVGPYRLTGILLRVGDTWKWRVHHGSEPLLW